MFCVSNAVDPDQRNALSTTHAKIDDLPSLLDFVQISLITG